MAVTRDEMLADLKKARLRKFVYIGAAIGLALLAIALVVTYFVRTPVHDLAAIILAFVAVIFSGLMTNQSLRTRKIEEMISERLGQADESESAQEGVPSDAGQNAPSDADESTSGDEGSDQDEP